VLAMLFFPSGLFVAYGSARLLSWARAIMLAILSYGCLIGFVQIMVHLERGGASGVVPGAAILVGVMMFCGWGFLLYRIGQRVRYWSPTALRGWRRAGWVAVVVLCLACINVVLQFFVARLHTS
jgi:hypothetical protein